ncbi:MAG: transposase [Acutalibacter muris]|nr:transposase [Acutalibacter muris]
MLKPHLPGQRGQWGGIAQNNRCFINVVFWILRTGALWRDLPRDYGKWGRGHQRFISWRRKGIWEIFTLHHPTYFGQSWTAV